MWLVTGGASYSAHWFSHFQYHFHVKHFFGLYNKTIHSKGRVGKCFFVNICSAVFGNKTVFLSQKNIFFGFEGSQGILKIDSFFGIFFVGWWKQTFLKHSQKYLDITHNSANNFATKIVDFFKWVLFLGAPVTPHPLLKTSLHWWHRSSWRF